MFVIIIRYNTYVIHMFMIEQCDTFASRTPFASSAWACEEPGSGETNSTVTLKRCLRVIFQEGSKLQRSQRWQPTCHQNINQIFKIQSLQQLFFLESCHFYVFFIWYHPNPLAIPTFSTSLLHSKALKLVQRDVITSFHIFSSELLCQQCSFRSIFRFQNVFMTDKGIGWGWGFGGARSVGLGTRWHGAGSGKRVQNSRETARNATKHNNGASRRLLHQTS